MIYSGSHSLALSRLYFETFDVPVPLDIARCAAREGRMQDLMLAVQTALNTGVAIADWTPYAMALPPSSLLTERVAA